MSARTTPTVRCAGPRLDPDDSRVVTQLFVPGQEGFDHLESRASAVVARLLRLDDDEVESALADVLARFGDRHLDLRGTFERHAEAVHDRLDPRAPMSDARRQLIGATFTSEYTIEGAALCNPSMIPHPDRPDVAHGSLGFVMSVRAIGEGHRSTIGFRTGTVDATGTVELDPAPRFTSVGAHHPAPLDVAIFRAELHREGCEGENADTVLDPLPAQFSPAQLEERIHTLNESADTRHGVERTVAVLRAIASRSYGVEFPGTRSITERVLWPAMEAERHGMEDARFVRFTDDDGAVTHYATYTAYDGSQISQQLLRTDDFRSFTSAPLVGHAAMNKGLALFPRRIGGRFAALSRWDRESNSVALTDDIHCWPTATPFQDPSKAWELLQLGNCGPPIETPEGWLVLTHGVGPMRTYSIGAILLDADDPTIVRGQLPRPLLSPSPDDRDGYVPNVVYSCGALVHGGNLVLPYGICDHAIGFGTVAIADVLAAMQPPTRG